MNKESFNPEEMKNQYQPTFNRKTKLTLEILGKLRRIRDARRYDMLVSRQLKSIQYGIPLDGGSAE